MQNKTTAVAVVVAIVVVVVFLGVAIVLGGAMVISSSKTSDRARQSTKADLMRIHSACEMYYATFRTYPLSLGMLCDEITTAAGVKVPPFLEMAPTARNAEGDVLDPWGQPIQYDVEPDSGPKLRSAGPDREYDTVDDINIATRITE